MFSIAFLPPLPDSDIGASLASDQCRQLLDYWWRKRGSDRITRRSRIDPVEIPTLLPDIVMIQRDGPAPYRWRYTLIGTRVVDMAGQESTGKYLDELNVGKYLGPIGTMYTEVCDRGAIRVTRGTMGFVDGRDHVTWEALHLPLSQDGTNADRILVIMPAVPAADLS